MRFRKVVLKIRETKWASGFEALHSAAHGEMNQ
jgi:hypothetical protein